MTVFRPPHGDECPICRQNARDYLRSRTGEPPIKPFLLGMALLCLLAVVVGALLFLAIAPTAHAQALGDDWRLEQQPAPYATVPELDVANAIDQTAGRYGVSAPLMRRIAWCESRYFPGARNPSGAVGLFQFLPSTWARAASGAGVWWATPFDPAPAIEAAAWLLRVEGPHHWSACL